MFTKIELKQKRLSESDDIFTYYLDYKYEGRMTAEQNRYDRFIISQTTYEVCRYKKLKK